MNGRLDSFCARSSSIFTIRPRGIPDLREVSLSHCARSSVLGIKGGAPGQLDIIEAAVPVVRRDTPSGRFCNQRDKKCYNFFGQDGPFRQG